ncbi:hypothetical protein RchiOBHm_Chr6g0259491 [Rosa chinensis]|uniref:Uncharacterized protein n=1 Tax=Rosa chinensis TaxID=74649 RepID=A0A2P6PMV3_ROSCH|nr:hypothetical protein RchiOBHm_Chr6g0259491 [Rosa chinensis]
MPSRFGCFPFWTRLIPPCISLRYLYILVLMDGSVNNFDYQA